MSQFILSFGRKEGGWERAKGRGREGRRKEGRREEERERRRHEGRNRVKEGGGPIC